MGFCQKTNRKNKIKYISKISVLYPHFVFSSQPQEIKDLREYLSLTTRVIHGIKEVGEIFFKHNLFSFPKSTEKDHVLLYKHNLINF